MKTDIFQNLLKNDDYYLVYKHGQRGIFLYLGVNPKNKNSFLYRYIGFIKNGSLDYKPENKVRSLPYFNTMFIPLTDELLNLIKQNEI